MPEQNLQEFLYDNDVYTAWQFVKNTKKTISTAQYCKDTIDALISKMDDSHQAWQSSLMKQLMCQESRDGEFRSVSITADNLPDCNIDVLGTNIPVNFLLDKLIKDFFQYSRNAFDCMAQAVNAGCLAVNAKKLERIDFGEMNKIINQQTYSAAFPDMNTWFASIEKSNEFQYIDAFCNRTKHTCDIYLKISIAILGTENQTILNPFFRKDQQYEKRDISTYLSSVCEFVQISYENFLIVLKNEIKKKTFIKNRVHKLKVYQKKMKDSPDSSFSVVYIDETTQASKMPDEIQVLLLQKYSNGEIVSKNCCIDTIYINDPTKQFTFTGKYVASEPCGDDTLLRYRKYTKELPQDGLPLHLQAMMDAENHKVFYHSNPFFDISTVSDEPEFRARVQLPF